MSVKSKLILALSFILVAAFVTTSVINYVVTRDTVRDELLNSSLPLTGKNIYSEIHEAMMRPILVSSSMANDSFLRSWAAEGELDPTAITRYLYDFKNKYGFLTAFFVSAKTDNYYYQDGILKKVGARDPHDIWFYAFTRSGNEFDLDLDTNEAEGGALTIFANFRVEDDNGRLLGVTGVGVNIDHVTELLAQAREDYDRETYLVDQDGLMQVHQDRRKIERYYITKAGGIRDVAPDILKERSKAASFEYDRDGEHFLLSTRYIPELQWHLIVEQSEDNALESARHNLIRTLAIGSCVSILIIALCVVTVNHFQGRLERLAQTDPLTGAANRRALQHAFDHAAYKADRYDNPFSAIILDLDKFKEINDKFGHIQGDAVLKRVADILTKTLRPTDLLARWGGDEFIILMDGNHDDATSLARRALKAVSDSPEEPSITFSYGLAQYEEGDDIEALTMRADMNLYQTKTGQKES